MKRFGAASVVLSIFLTLTALAGCSSVTISRPLPPMSNPAELSAFEGEWVSEGQVLHVRIGEDGVGRFAAVDWKEGSFRLDEGEFVVTRSADKGFLSVRIMEDGKWLEGYFLARYLFTGEGDLVLWLPDVEAFADAVRKGRLEGAVEKGAHNGSVTITSAPDKVLGLVKGPASDELFVLREPMFIKKLLLSPPPREAEPLSIPGVFEP